MNYKKAILGAASVLALTAGMQTASASIPPSDRLVAESPQATSPAASQAGLVFDFVARTNGTFTSAAIEDTLTAMLGDASREQIEGVPLLYENIASLGLMPDTMADAKDVLLRIVSTASSIDDDVRAAVSAQLEDGNKQIQLAAGNDDVDNTHRPRDPNIIGAGGNYQ